MKILTLLFSIAIIISTQLHASAGLPALAAPPQKQADAPSPLAQLYTTKFSQGHAERWKTISAQLTSLSPHKNRRANLLIPALSSNATSKMLTGQEKYMNMECTCKSRTSCDCRDIRSLSWHNDDRVLAVVTKHRVELLDTIAGCCVYDSMNDKQDKARKVWDESVYIRQSCDGEPRTSGPFNYRGTYGSVKSTYDFKRVEERDFVERFFEQNLRDSIDSQIHRLSHEKIDNETLKAEVAKDGFVATAAASSDGGHLAYITRACHTDEHRCDERFGRYWICDIHILNTDNRLTTRLQTPIRVDGQEKNNDAPRCQLTWDSAQPECHARIDDMTFTYNPRRPLAFTRQLGGTTIKKAEWGFQQHAPFQYFSREFYDAPLSEKRFKEETPNIYAQKPTPPRTRKITVSSHDGTSIAQWEYPNDYIRIREGNPAPNFSSEQLGFIHCFTEQAEQFKDKKKYPSRYFSLNKAAPIANAPGITAAELARVLLTLPDPIRKQLTTLHQPLKLELPVYKALQIVLGSEQDTDGRIAKELEEFLLEEWILGRKVLPEAPKTNRALDASKNVPPQEPTLIPSSDFRGLRRSPTNSEQAAARMYARFGPCQWSNDGTNVAILGHPGCGSV